MLFCGIQIAQFGANGPVLKIVLCLLQIGHFFLRTVFLGTILGTIFGSEAGVEPCARPVVSGIVFLVAYGPPMEKRPWC